MSHFIAATLLDDSQNTATRQPNLPPGSVANGFCFMVHTTASNAVAEYTAPGWTKLLGAAAGNLYVFVAYKKLDATDIATGHVVFTRTATGDNHPLFMIAFDAGLSAIDAVVTVPLAAGTFAIRASSVATTVAPAVTPTGPATGLVFAIERTLATGTTSSFAAGTKVYDQEANATANTTVSVAELALTAGVSSGTDTVTANSASGNGLAFILPMTSAASFTQTATGTVTAGGSAAGPVTAGAAASSTVTAGGTTAYSVQAGASASGTVTAIGSATTGGFVAASASSTVAAGGTVGLLAQYSMGATSIVTALGNVSPNTAYMQAVSGTIKAQGSAAGSTLTPVDLWIAKTPMYCAHRGGSDDWPEETMFAYAQAAAWNPDLALEISVWQCSTGEWVCSHDQTTGRMFGTDRDIPTTSWATLSTLRTTVGNQPICRLTDVLDLYGNTRVLMVDNKGSQSVSAFFNLLDSYAGNKRYIIKQFNTGNSVPTEAHVRGYKTWGYYYQADVAVNLPATQSRWDLLGMDVGADGPSWTAVLSYGKVVLAHIINSAANATLAFSKGATGLMVSKVTQAVPNTGFVVSATVTANGTTTAKITYLGSSVGTITAMGSVNFTTKVAASASATVRASGAVNPIVPPSIGGLAQGWGIIQI